MSNSDPGIAERIAQFQAKIADAAVDAGRERDGVRLIAVTKNHPWHVAAAALRAGVLDLGENKVQELAAKRTELEQHEPELAATATWHFIGRLQRNKAGKAVAAADSIGSLDRVAIAEAVGRAAESSDRWSADQPLPVLIQVDLDPARTPGDGDSTSARGGAHPDDISSIADAISGVPSLQLRGLMAVAPIDVDPAECFARLAELSTALRARFPAATEISAGMSGDFAQAIASGSTCVRVGTALFGDRTLTSNA